MKIEVSNGEILDKHTILAIKLERIQDSKKLAHVQHEMSSLAVSVKEVYALVKEPAALHKHVERLKDINERLWEVEDDLRNLESRADFGSDFIEKARSVYFLNDERAAVKRTINALTGSDIHEAKSYTDYTSPEGHS